MTLGDFRERFSTRLHPCSPASHPVLWDVASPQRGEARWGAVPQAAVGGGHCLRVPPSNLPCATAWAQRASRFPPLGGDKESVHTAVGQNEGGSF